MKQVSKLGHQGDVPFMKLDISEKTARRLAALGSAVEADPHGTTMLVGEGAHVHAFADTEAVESFSLPSSDNVMRAPKVTIVKRDTALDHLVPATKQLSGEHDSIKFLKATYLFGSQREADLDGQLRRVLD